MKRSKWSCYIEDVGEVTGGFLIGYGISRGDYAPIIAGIGLVIFSLYIEYLTKNKKNPN